MTVLDFVAARAVAMAKMLERALHDPGPWSISFAGMREEAVRIVTPSRILFLAQFPAVCVIDRSSMVELWVRDDCLAVRPSPLEDDEELSGNSVTIRWEIVLEDRERVSR